MASDAPKMLSLGRRGERWQWRPSRRGLFRRSLPRRSALLVAVPEAEVIYQHWPGDRSRIGVPGLPLHVTVLFPFMPPAAIDRHVERDLEQLTASCSRFAYALSRVDRFPGVLYLEPSPGNGFAKLTEAVLARWPEYPPYDGKYPDLVPHLTLVEGGEPDGLAAAVESVLPIRAVARDLLLMVSDEAGIWRPCRRFSLGGA